MKDKCYWISECFGGGSAEAGIPPTIGREKEKSREDGAGERSVEKGASYDAKMV